MSHNSSSSSSEPADLDMEKARPTPSSAPGTGPPAGGLKLGIKLISINGIMLTIVFWLAASWLLGTFYGTPSKVHQVTVWVADFDQGPIGQALVAAAQAYDGEPTAPHFEVISVASTTPDEVLRRVWEGKSWGVIYAAPGASAAYEAALASDATAASYNPASALVYSALEVRYANFVLGPILGGFRNLQALTTQAFVRSTTVPFLASNTAALGPNQARVLAAPIAASYRNLTPLPQGIRSILNSVFFVYPVLLQFFVILGMNGILTMTGVYARSTFRQLLVFRCLFSTLWTLWAGLTIAAWQFTFSESYHWTAKQVFALWTVYWIMNLIYFDILDVLTTFFDMRWVPFMTILVIIITVSSTAWPIEACYRFYRIHYAVPAHAAWQATITIYGRGAVNKLSQCLPVLAAWLVVMKAASVIAVRKRARDAQAGKVKAGGH